MDNIKDKEGIFNQGIKIGLMLKEIKDNQDKIKDNQEINRKDILDNKQRINQILEVLEKWVEGTIKNIDMTQNTKQEDTKPELITYNPASLNRLYDLAADDWSVNFIENIQDSEYTTVTAKQFKVLNDIAMKYKFEGKLKA